MVPRLRRLLASRPRLVLALLLAFAVEIVPPSAGGVRHHHAGGEVGHTHAGRIVAADAADLGEQAGARVGDGLAAAPPRDLHHHDVQPMVGLRGPTAPAARPPLLVSEAPAAPAPAEIPVAQRVGSARAPPTRLA